MSHLHKETHTIEESAPLAGATQRRGANLAQAIPVAGQTLL